MAKARRLNPSEDKQRLEAAVCQLLMTIKRQEQTVGVVEESCMFKLREQQEACNALLEQQAGRFSEVASHYRSSANQAVQRERSSHSQLVDRLWQELTEASTAAAKCESEAADYADIHRSVANVEQQMHMRISADEQMILELKANAEALQLENRHLHEMARTEMLAERPGNYNESIDSTIALHEEINELHRALFNEQTNVADRFHALNQRIAELMRENELLNRSAIEEQRRAQDAVDRSMRLDEVINQSLSLIHI